MGFSSFLICSPILLSIQSSRSTWVECQTGTTFASLLRITLVSQRTGLSGCRRNALHGIPRIIDEVRLLTDVLLEEANPIVACM